MKKIIFLLLSFLIFSTALFSKDFFDGRFLELKAGSNVSFSNNTYSLDQLFVQDLVIDLRDLADNVPASGFSVAGNASPLAALKFRIGGLSLGLNAGVEMHEQMNIAKDLFDFLGYGNEIGKTISVDVDNNLDIFAFVNFDLAFEVKRFQIKVTPSFFAPLFATTGTVGTVSILNDSYGNVIARLDANTGLYTTFNMEEKKFNVEDVVKSAGFDIAGQVNVPISEKLKLEAKTRIPIIPGRLNKMTLISGTFLMEANALSMSDMTTYKNFDYANDLDASYQVNRPMKVNAYFDYKPMAKLLDIRAGFGLGINHPFTENTTYYPEYYFGIDLNLLRMFTFKLSSEYTDKVYIHQFGFDFNVRFIELDVGISAQSNDFVKSFTGTGLGAYAFITLGI